MASAPSFVTAAHDRLPDVLADLERLVAIESPSSDPVACRACLDAVADIAEERTGTRPRVIERGGRHHLLWSPGRPRVLLLGHADTVWPTGTLDRWPFRVEGDVATGPGAFDMKAGIVLGVHALALRGGPDGAAMLLTDDEEIGSETSRPVIEQHAGHVESVLVLEPAAGHGVKTGRKGISAYEVEIEGRAAHAGLEPERGANALVAMAALIPEIVALADPATGTTVTPTTATAGTAINVVPAGARVGVDVRAPTRSEQDRVHAGMRALGAHLEDVGVRLHGGISRPPLEPTVTGPLYQRAVAVAASLGLGDLPGATVGGGSDGNFTGAMGVPTLDGLGPVGDGAHAEGEHVVVSALPARLALLAGVLDDLLV